MPKRLDISKLKQNSKRQAFINDICSRLDALALSSKDPDENWTVFRDTVHSSAMESLEPGSSKHQDWFYENDEEIQGLLEEKYQNHKATRKGFLEKKKQMSPQSCQSCHSCTQRVISSCSTFVPSIIMKGIPVTEQTRNLFQTKQREITPKVRKPELSFWYVTRRLVQFYISTKYHKNIPDNTYRADTKSMDNHCQT